MQGKLSLDLAYEHSWRMFDRHAQQRVDCFNLFVLVLGGLLAASLVSIEKDQTGFLTAIVGAICLGSYAIFSILEARTRELVKNSEAALKKFEDAFAKSCGQQMCMLATADKQSELSKTSYSKAFQTCIGDT